MRSFVDREKISGHYIAGILQSEVEGIPTSQYHVISGGLIITGNHIDEPILRSRSLNGASRIGQGLLSKSDLQFRIQADGVSGGFVRSYSWNDDQ